MPKTSTPAREETSLFTRRDWLARGLVLLAAAPLAHAAQTKAEKAKSGKIQTPPPNHPPLQPVDIAQLPPDLERLDLFLLLGQSNMKGRGIMPDEPSRDPRIVMMHLRDDRWYVARHPLHLVGDASTFQGADNAGVGPGMAFAEVVRAREPKVRIGLIPCAVGGSPIAQWQKGARLYDQALRRARLALSQTAAVNARIRAALWLQGEADATPAGLPVHEAKLLKLVDDLRADLAEPALPFIAATIGEMRDDESAGGRAAMNRLLLSLPDKRPHTGCVDGRDLRTHIGDHVHFDTAAQNAIGRRYAEKYYAVVKR